MTDLDLIFDLGQFSLDVLIVLLKEFMSLQHVEGVTFSMCHVNYDDEEYSL